MLAFIRPERLNDKSPLSLTTKARLYENATMSTPSPDSLAMTPGSELPDRQCAWCKINMNKRLVGEDRFIHYTCPACIFQHTSKREAS